jgi:TetR/AcrR family transcriptional regulator
MSYNEKKGNMREKRVREKRDESVRRILDSAMEAFAEVGYEGARVDDIAKRAGVNKAMIYYRIGDKKTLYEEVIHYVFGGIAVQISENIRDECSPEEKFKIYLANILKTMSNHPAFPRIMMREVASGWTNFSEAMAKDIVGVVAIVKRIIDEGVKAGAFIDVNPFIVHIMTVGTMMLFNQSMPVRKNFAGILEGELSIPKEMSLEQVFSELEKMLLRALKVKK